MKTTNYLSIFKRMMSSCFAIILLFGCDQTNIEYTFPDSSDNPIGEPVAINISLQDFSEYNTTDKSTAATRSDKPLISEYVKLNTFSLTRSTKEAENPKMIGLMELSEDTVPPSPQTRSTMSDGYYFRLIIFSKVGTDYVFQAAADYTSNGTSVPVLKQGILWAFRGQTCRIVGYSFNNNSALGTLPDTFQWNGTSIPIPDLTNDFLTFDSGDKTIPNTTYSLPVTFTHKLCKLTVKVVGKYFGSNTITNCTGIYIKEGGNQSSWKVGTSDIAANTENTTPFDFPSDSSIGTTRLVPYTSTRPITVHFNTINVEETELSNLEVISSQSVKLAAGRSYTMNVTITAEPLKTINVPASAINLGGNECTVSDKSNLSKLIWAVGNLNSTENSKYYTWAARTTDYGYYYTWKSTYTGDTSQNNTDPCSKLNVSEYGSGWRTPSHAEFEMLSHCTDKVLTNGGMWFMNKTIGLFLPAAGNRLYDEGSGITPTYYSGSHGVYWCSDDSNFPISNMGYFMSFYSSSASIGSGAKTCGYPVRCVKG